MVTFPALLGIDDAAEPIGAALGGQGQPAGAAQRRVTPTVGPAAGGA